MPATGWEIRVFESGGELNRRHHIPMNRNRIKDTGHLEVMDSSSMSNQNQNLAHDLIGVWWLLSREDVAADGSTRTEPTLGSDPLGILTYSPGHFAAQFMKRDRSSIEETENSVAGKNNTAAVGGYDAYFGTYEVTEVNGAICL